MEAPNHKQFADLLDGIIEVRCNAAASNDTRLEPRVARLEPIVQQMLLALVEQAEPEDAPRADGDVTRAEAVDRIVAGGARSVEIVRKPE
jgi:hypothetical protein